MRRLSTTAGVMATALTVTVLIAPPARAVPDAPPSAPTTEHEDRTRLLPPDGRRSPDLAWTTSGDATGFHILIATAASEYDWRTVATLSEPGFDADQWIGNACLTGSGRRLVVVYAPRTFTNRPDLFDRGGFTAVVDLTTGAVTKVPVLSTLAYFNPGCGTAETAVLTQLGGDREDKPTDHPGRSRLFRLDAAQGRLSAPITVRTEVTSAVPTSAGIVAAASAHLVRVRPDGMLTRLIESSGVPFHLHPDAGGGVTFMDRSGDRIRVRRAAVRAATSATAPVVLATGVPGDVGIASGAGGRVFLTGTPTTVSPLPAPLRRLAAPREAEISSTGHLALTRPDKDRLADPRGAAPSTARPVTIQATVVATGATSTFRLALSAAAVAGGGSELHPKLAASPDPWTPGSPTNPIDTERWCSVPRNDPRNQAMQPKPRQVEWAVNQAITNTPYAARPANWKNLGMPAYEPLRLFPRIELEGGGRVPAQVMLGILAQESNLWQASRVAVPGVTANPLIGNFYGRPIYNTTEADDWDVQWEDADCGYGVAQVTDGMRRAGFEKENEVARPWDHQRAIALDFAANIAAGARILQDKWNQTRRGGLIVNTGEVMAMESWFFAIWAYNSGFYPDRGDGSPWGVGWSNNPINPRYPADRDPFLEFTYNDARNPQRWPYPEKVLGFAGHPPELLEGPDQLVAAYRAAWWPSDEDRRTVKPPNDLFCTVSNDCYPGQRNVPDAPDMEGEPAGPCAHVNEIGQYDLRCWWHDSVSWKEGFQAGNELLRFDPGYEYQADATSYPPRCTMAGLPMGALVIDNMPDGAPSIRPNCGRPWTNAGTFGFQFAGTGDGRYPSKVDLHQIGGGFGGHFWFGHARRASAEGNLMKITGTWRLNRQIDGWARVLVHLPDHGAHTEQAAYQIDLGSGFASGKRRYLPQRTQEHRWVSLGVFRFSGTPRVALSTESFNGTGVEDVAWDAVAFQTLTAKPRHQVVALGDSYSSGEGASVNRGEDYYRESDYKQLINNEAQFQNTCHRSRHAWSRQAVLSDSTASIGTRADQWDPQMDYQFHACSGAETENLLPFHSVPAGESKPANAFGQQGKGAHGEVSQLDKGYLDENTTLVTLSIGGNDARFADIVVQRIFKAVGLCQNSTLEGDSKPLAEATAERLAGPVKESIKIVLREIRKRAPNAKILLMGYPKLLERNGQCIGGIGTEEAPWLNDTGDVLATRMAEAVADVRAEGVQAWFANPVSAFSGRAICADDEAVNGIITDLTPGEHGPLPAAAPESWNKYGSSRQSFHPKISGASIYAQVMGSVVRGQMDL